jgi:hypothetical protein
MLTIEYRKVMENNTVRFFYQMSTELSITTFDDRNIFPTSFMYFYTPVEFILILTIHL